MSSIGMHWHLLVVLIIVMVGCGESHSADDGGTGDTGSTDTGSTDTGSTDTGTVDAVADSFGGDDCPPIGPPMCIRGACCDEDPVFAEPIPGSCSFACPDGWELQSTCVIEDIAFCGDGCVGNEDCTLAINTCCGTCSVPTLSDFDAIHVDDQDAHRLMVCPDPVPCPLCAMGFNPNLGATCNAGSCEGFDLSMMPVTACTDDIDCRVRARGCCECGADTSFSNLIAIRGDAVGLYESLVCPSDFACLECAPVYPDDVGAFCDAGRCALEMLP